MSLFELFISSQEKQIEKQVYALGNELRIQPKIKRGWSQLIYKQYPQLDGKYQGRDLLISMTSRKRKNRRIFKTQVTLGLYNHYNYDLRITKENFLSKMGKYFGVKDIEIGHPPFDDNFRIQSSDTYFPETVLSEPLIIDKFKRISKEFKGELLLEGHELIYEEQLALLSRKERNHVKKLLDLMDTLARYIEGFGQERRPTMNHEPLADL